MTGYPIPGRCGACHLPAEQYPSGRWSHLAQPGCNQAAGWHHDILVPSPPYVFVPEGQPLPEPPARGVMVVASADESGFPTSLGWLSQDRIAEFWARWRARALSVHAEVVGSVTFAGEVEAADA